MPENITCPVCNEGAFDGVQDLAEHISQTHTPEEAQEALSKLESAPMPKAAQEVPIPLASAPVQSGEYWESVKGSMKYVGPSDKCPFCDDDISHMKQPGRHVNACARKEGIEIIGVKKPTKKPPQPMTPTQEKLSELKGGVSLGQVIAHILPESIFSKDERDHVRKTWDTFTSVKIEKWCFALPGWAGGAIAIGDTMIVLGRAGWRKVKDTPEAQGAMNALKMMGKGD